MSKHDCKTQWICIFFSKRHENIWHTERFTPFFWITTIAWKLEFEIFCLPRSLYLKTYDVSQHWKHRRWSRSYLSVDLCLYNAECDANLFYNIASARVMLAFLTVCVHLGNVKPSISQVQNWPVRQLDLVLRHRFPVCTLFLLIQNKIRIIIFRVLACVASAWK